MRPIATLVLFLLLAFAAAAVGGFFAPGPWYAALDKPVWTPPGWVFGPVWTALYLMIGIAGWLLWKAGSPARFALALWGLQLGLNALWSPLFFGLEAPGAALVMIVLLLAAIAATVAVARRTVPVAAWLLVPYLAWVAFATALNAAIWRLN